jgi:hypothetical protein
MQKRRRHARGTRTWDLSKRYWWAKKITRTVRLVLSLLYRLPDLVSFVTFYDIAGTSGNYVQNYFSGSGKYVALVVISGYGDLAVAE